MADESQKKLDIRFLMSDKRKMPMPEEKERQKKARKKRGWIAFLLIVILVLVILVGVGMAFYFSIVFDLPRLTTLKDYQPYITSGVYSEDEVLIGEFFVERRTVISLSQMPRFLPKAFIAAEDARFFEHGGIDYWRIWAQPSAILRPWMWSREEARSPSRLPSPSFSLRNGATPGN